MFAFPGRLLLSLALCTYAKGSLAQAPTSASIGGRIIDANGRGLQNAEVVVTNRATGFAMRVLSRDDGRYLISGLEVGGPYTVIVRRIGSPMRTRAGIFLSLGQQLHEDISLEQQALLLQAMETRTTRDGLFSRGHQGTETLVSDSVIHQMPIINRDLYDLVRLVPQISTLFDLVSSGTGPRVNSIRIDGVSDQVPSSNLAAGALYGGKVVPLDAVSEYQVLLSSYDVRQGSFAGASVNVVTRSGTNEVHGSVFGYGTNEQLGPNVPLVRGAPYQKGQFGVSLGGPVVHDHLLFFVSSEIQRREIPAIGPYVGESPGSSTPLPVRTTDIARFQQLLNVHGLEGGSAGPVTNPNPSSIHFLRLDAPVPRWNSRLTLRGTYGHADSSIFARPTMLAPTDCPSTACFPLSSLQHSRWVNKSSAALQLVSNFSNGAYNELLAGYVGILSGFRPTVMQPLILVTVPGTSGAPAILQAGTHEIATGQRNASSTSEITDNFSISKGPHRITTGVSAQLFGLRAFQLRGSYGVWEFASLDSFQTGTASQYRITRDTGSVTAASGGYYAAYIGDDWEASSRLSLTFGLRADASALLARLPYVPGIDSTFGLRTDRVPGGSIQWSPRIGFNFDLTRAGEGPSQVRGGVGLFTGRSPLFWLFGGFAAYGLAARTLRCGALPGDAGPAPGFSPDSRNPPMACADGNSFAAATSGEIDALDAHLRLPETMRSSLAFDRTLPLGTVGTVEAMYTRTLSAMYFSSINLDSVGVDRYGRLMYGAIGATGLATPARPSPRFGDVIKIMNESKDYAYDLTGELRRYGDFADLQASLSYGAARDIATPRPVSALIADDWRYGRPTAGREDDLALGTSDFDQPLRLRVAGTLRSPWRRLRTELSLMYIGGSGYPYTYVAGGAQGYGDLNADGAVGNDPIYIPRSAFDTAEIRFGGSTPQVQAQQAALERFIDGDACLRRQRGRIMSRNSCRSPWMSRSNLAIRQALPMVRAQSLLLELQVFNFLNLLDSRWGRLQVPTGAMFMTTSQIPLLSQVGETTGTQAQPIYRFDPLMPRYSFENYDSYYQVQLAIRYSF